MTNEHNPAGDSLAKIASEMRDYQPPIHGAIGIWVDSWADRIEALAASHRERSERHAPNGANCAQGEAVARWTEIARDGQLSDWSLEMASLRKYFAGLASPPADKPAGQAVTDAQPASTCGCQKELTAMLAHSSTDFDYMTACHCHAYPQDQRCDCVFCKRALSALAPEPATAGVTLPRAWGVSRMNDNAKAVLVSFRDEPTDDQLRHLHEMLAGRATPAAAVPDGPLGVFDDGPWTYGETGQNFTGADLDGAAYAAYRDAGLLAAAPNRPADAQRGVPVAILRDAHTVLTMVETNQRVRDGEVRKAWDGKFVSAEVRRVIRALDDALAASPAEPLPASEVSRG